METEHRIKVKQQNVIMAYIAPNSNKQNNCLDYQIKPKRI